MGNLYLTLFVAIAVVGFAASCGIILWLNHLLPSAVTKKYSRMVVLQCKLPYPSDWQAKVEVDDVPIFEKYRKVFLLWYLFALLLLGLEILLLLQI